MKSSAPACRPRILCSRAFSPVTSATGMSRVSGACLQLGADLEAVDAGHLDIQQHQVGLQVTKRRERLGPGGDRHDVIAEPLQQPHEERAVDLFVVADENGSERRGSLEHQWSVPERSRSAADVGRGPYRWIIVAGRHTVLATVRISDDAHAPLSRQPIPAQGSRDRRPDWCDGPARRARAREPARRRGVAGASRRLPAGLRRSVRGPARHPAIDARRRRKASIGALISMVIALLLINAPFLAGAALLAAMAGFFVVDAARYAV